jgi:hypothetical protein
MYVDKKLDGVNAVQTLLRLNRIFAGKVAGSAECSFPFNPLLRAACGISVRGTTFFQSSDHLDFVGGGRIGCGLAP